MPVYPQLKLRFPFEVTEIGDETVAVPVEEGADRFHGIIKLKNESARFMFDRLRDGIALPDLIFACMKQYGDEDVEAVGTLVIEFVEQLGREGVLGTVKSADDP